MKSILDAHLSSQEEGIFGGLLEELAIFICQRAYGGIKSSAEGIDLEFIDDGVRYIISVKSDPNWGNSSQIAKMKDHFRKYQKNFKHQFWKAYSCDRHKWLLLRQR